MKISVEEIDAVCDIFRKRGLFAMTVIDAEAILEAALTVRKRLKRERKAQKSGLPNGA